MMTSYDFDNKNVQWHSFGDFDHFVYSILNIDEKNLIFDLLFKFDANKQIFLHRHKALNTSFVVQGEHRLYEPNGDIKEVRAVGSYTTNPANADPHREGGGNEGAVVLFSIRESSGILYEILDDEENLVATLSMQDLINLHNLEK